MANPFGHRLPRGHARVPKEFLPETLYGWPLLATCWDHQCSRRITDRIMARTLTWGDLPAPTCHISGISTSEHGSDVRSESAGVSRRDRREDRLSVRTACLDAISPAACPPSLQTKSVGDHRRHYVRIQFRAPVADASLNVSFPESTAGALPVHNGVFQY